MTNRDSIFCLKSGLDILSKYAKGMFSDEFGVLVVLLEEWPTNAEHSFLLTCGWMKSEPGIEAYLFELPENLS